MSSNPVVVASLPRDYRVALKPEAPRSDTRYIVVIATVIISLLSIVVAISCIDKLGYWSFAVGGALFTLGSIITYIGAIRFSQPSSSSLPVYETHPLHTIQLAEAPGQSMSPGLPFPDHDQLNQLLPLSAYAYHTPHEEIQEIWHEKPPLTSTEWLGIADILCFMSYIAYGHSNLNIGEDLYDVYPEGELRICNLETYLFTYFPQNLPEYETKNLATAIYHGNHWTFLFIDREKREIVYFDSKRDWNRSKTRDTLQRITTRLSTQTSEQPPFTLVYKINKVIQKDSYQCTIWCFFFFAKFLEDFTFDFNTLDNQAGQRLIQQYRTHVSYIQRYMLCAHSLLVKEEQRSYREAYHYETESAALSRLSHRRPQLLRENWNRVLANRPIRPDQSSSL